MKTIDYLQDIVKEIKEVKVITGVQDSENDFLQIAIRDLYNDQFIQKVTIGGIERYEEMLNVIPLGTDTLQDRVFRIKALYNKQVPYTRTGLEKSLKNLCGENGYKIVYDFEKSLLTVKIELTAKTMFNTVKDYLDSVVPLNLIVDLMLMYNQYRTLSKCKYKEIRKYTYKQLREEVIS